MSMDQPRPRSKEKLSSLLKVKSCNSVTLASEEIFFLPISHVALLVKHGNLLICDARSVMNANVHCCISMMDMQRIRQVLSVETRRNGL
ncbi:hypothetical protein EPI10_021318 [Gossypium australe]|uniref:Uncharacterized protein n=1 Tax=Gossypium australe TaxID=47621 RepID=A0A5B6WJ92_9ROSI|nr:hypothetical protein EPI10_021318 [Gossypium australe]